MRKIPEHTAPANTLPAAEWRRLVQATAEAYLAPDFNSRMRLSVQKIARRQGYQLPDGPPRVKAERYALAAAAIHRITGQLVEGTGTQARFRPGCLPAEPPFAMEDPFETLESVVRLGHYQTAEAAECDLATHVGYLLRRFAQISFDPDHVTAGFIRTGGTMPFELKYYARATARAFGETPLTRRFGQARRIAIAHQLLPLLTSRAAQHLDQSLEGRSWRCVEHMHPHIETLAATGSESAPAAGRTELYRLLGPDGETLFPLVGRLADAMAPLIRCPAHQRLFGAESALQLQLHAGINYAGDNGLYHPSLAVPAPL